MENKNLTAIDWLYEQIKYTNKEVYNELFEQYHQAKALEKQEIIDAYCEGLNEWNIKEDSAMKYYNNTFKQE